MKPFEIIVLIVLAFLFIIMCSYYAKRKRGIVKFIFGVSSGIIFLFPVQLILGSFGIHISINILTLTIAGILGIPGVVLITALSLF